jgi:hypothetical protein
MTKLEAEWIKTKMGIVEHCVKQATGGGMY